MPDHTTQALLHPLLEVVERMAFLFGDPVPPGELEAPERFYSGSISFNGSDTGRMTVMTSRDMARVLAENVLGCAPDEVVPELEVNALREVMNVVLGHILTSLESKEAVFDVAVPEVSEESSTDAWAALAARPGTIGVRFEEHPFLVRFEDASGSAAA